MLILDGGDFSMGTPSAAASREIGDELQVMDRMGYDATTSATGRPTSKGGQLPIIPIDSRAAEIRAI